MSVTELSEDRSATIDETWYQGAMNLAAQQNPDAVAEIRRLVEEAGLNDAE